MVGPGRDFVQEKVEIRMGESKISSEGGEE